MRAVQVTRYGGPEVLEPGEVEAPAAISTEVLVRVVAAGVNPVDVKTRRGDGVARWAGPPPFIPGWDVAGVVERMGYGVTRLAVGDRVYGMPRFPRAAGAYAELVTAPSLQLARVPRNLSDVEAAALPLAALTAWQSLVDVAALDSGQTVVVHGATGGVGHLAVQLARSRGAATLTTSSKDREALHARNVDVALDLVGGDDIAVLLRALRPGGLLVEVADYAPDEVRAEARRRSVRIVEPLVEPDGRALDGITKLVEAGDLKVQVEATFPLAQAAAAHRRLESGGVRGKIVLEVGDD